MVSDRLPSEVSREVLPRGVPAVRTHQQDVRRICRCGSFSARLLGKADSIVCDLLLNELARLKT